MLAVARESSSPSRLVALLFAARWMNRHQSGQGRTRTLSNWNNAVAISILTMLMLVRANQNPLCKNTIRTHLPITTVHQATGDLPARHSATFSSNVPSSSSSTTTPNWAMNQWCTGSKASTPTSTSTASKEVRDAADFQAHTAPHSTS